MVVVLKPKRWWKTEDRAFVCALLTQRKPWGKDVLAAEKPNNAQWTGLWMAASSYRRQNQYWFLIHHFTTLFFFPLPSCFQAVSLHFIKATHTLVLARRLSANSIWFKACDGPLLRTLLSCEWLMTLQPCWRATTRGSDRKTGTGSHHNRVKPVGGDI